MGGGVAVIVTLGLFRGWAGTSRGQHAHAQQQGKITTRTRVGQEGEDCQDESAHLGVWGVGKQAQGSVCSLTNRFSARHTHTHAWALKRYWVVRLLLGAVGAAADHAGTCGVGCGAHTHTGTHQSTAAHGQACTYSHMQWCSQRRRCHQRCAGAQGQEQAHGVGVRTHRLW